MTLDVQIRDVIKADIPKLNIVVNSVVSDRVFLAFTTPFTLSETEEFVLNNIEKGFPNVVAVLGKQVIGWCDIVAKKPYEFSHVGLLGMGFVECNRGKGVGKRLILSALERAHLFGFEKVELDVYHNNHQAKALYTKVGFEIEGVKKRTRKIDGMYQDAIIMGKFITNKDT